MSKKISGLEESLRINCIHILFGNDERLIYFLFHHMNARLRLSEEELIEEARELNSSEQVLIKVAIDFWNFRGASKLSEILEVLDYDNFIKVVKAMLKFRGLDLEDLEEQC